MEVKIAGRNPIPLVEEERRVEAIALTSSRQRMRFVPRTDSKRSS